MIHHMLKIVWNRKSSNALIILEIFVSFLVVFAVSALGIFNWQNYHRPLGYQIEDVWHIRFRVASGERIDAETARAANARVERIQRELVTMEPVVSAAAGRYAPYQSSSSRWSWTTSDGRQMSTEVIEATPGFPGVLGIQVTAGRWFEPGDRALHWQPVVVNRRLAKELFPDGDAVGQRVDLGNPEEDETPREMRVVGLIEDYRKAGELAVPSAMLFEPVWLEDAEQIMSELVIKLEPGTPAAFEEALAERLQALAPDWSFSVRALASQRDGYLRHRLAPLLVAGVVSVFLMLMVALGLLGVLWQNVTQRTLEVGLRRAKGATRPDIHWQILGEMLTIATLGLVAGLLVILQIPILGWFGFLDFTTYVLAFAVSVLCIYLLAAACSLYPSWLASRIQPAEALHYE